MSHSTPRYELLLSIQDSFRTSRDKKRYEKHTVRDIAFHWYEKKTWRVAKNQLTCIFGYAESKIIHSFIHSKALSGLKKNICVVTARKVKILE